MKKEVLLSLLGLGLFSQATLKSAQAATVVCRGGNAGAYVRAVKNEVAQQLTEQGVSFSAVVVTIKADDRKATKQTVTPDVSGNIGVSAQPLDVQFAGDLPAPASCQIPSTIRIKVLQGNAAIVDKTFATTINGTLLSGPGGF